MTKTRVLIAIDEPETAKCIVNTAVNFFDPNNTEITLLNVIETTGAEEELFLREPSKFIEHESRKSIFQDIENMLENSEFEYKGFIYGEGIASNYIVKACRKNIYDLIVIGCNDKNFFEKIFIGSTSYKVVRDVKCPVLVIKPKKISPENYTNSYRVLFATDGSEYSSYAANTLSKFLDTKKALVSVVNVRVPLAEILPMDAYSYADVSKIIEESETVSKEIVSETALTLSKNAFNIASKLNLEGDPATEIIKKAKDSVFDLIVIGSQGKNELSKFFMGSVSTKVYENSKVPILIIKR